MVFCRGPGAVSYTGDIAIRGVETQYSPKERVDNQTELLHGGIARDV